MFKIQNELSPSSLKPFTDFATMMKPSTFQGSVDHVWSRAPPSFNLIARVLVSYCAAATLVFFPFLECPKLFSLQSIHTSCVLCLGCLFLLCLSSFYFKCYFLREFCPGPSNLDQVPFHNMLYSSFIVFITVCIYTFIYFKTECLFLYQTLSSMRQGTTSVLLTFPSVQHNSWLVVSAHSVNKHWLSKGMNERFLECDIILRDENLIKNLFTYCQIVFYRDLCI